MKTRIMLFLLLCGFYAKAQNIEVSGMQSGVWDADTVFVTGDVVIQDSLYILPGTTVIFQDYYGLRVLNGASFHAIGNENDSILFTVIDTTGFHVYNSGRGGWNGIHADKASEVKLDYCRLQYGKAAKNEEQDGGALRIYYCNHVAITHSTLFCNFSREHGGAMNAEHSSVSMHNCNVNNNILYSEIDTIYFMYGGGLRFINCDVRLSDMTFRRNIGETAIGGALSLDSCSVNIERCIFEHNYGINGGGLYLIRSYYYPCVIANSLFAHNISGHFGGGLAISDSSPFISNLTVVGNHSYGVNCGGMFFYQNSSPIVRNCIVYGNTNEIPIEEPVQIWSWTYEGSAPEFYNCLIQYGFDNISNHEAITIYEGCLDVDPGFVNLENEDFHLAANSPCIDAGLTYEGDFYGYDLDGNFRVSNDQIDIGAYEFGFTGVQETAQSEGLVRIFGNPITASSYVEIETEKAGPLTASVYSLDGRLLNNNPLGYTQKGINRIEIGEMFQQLASGTYLFVVKNAERRIAAKVVKP